MQHRDLIESAASLTTPGPLSIAEYSEKKNLLTELVNSSLAMRPDLTFLVGIEGRRLSEEYNRHFALLMESLFLHHNPQALVDNTLWAYKTYYRQGFDPEYWETNIKMWMTAAKTVLSDRCIDELLGFYQWLLNHKENFIDLSDST